MPSVSARSDVVVRPLVGADAVAADAVAFAALRTELPAEVAADEERLHRWGRTRIAHFAATDPAGSWAAEQDGDVVGLAQAMVRDGLWGLSLLAVAPGRQGQGIGARLLEAALRCSDGAPAGLIVSSTDARALRRYARAGFAARPALEAAGPVNRSRIPDGLGSRPGDPDGDRDTIRRAGRACRGSAHGRADLRMAVDHGSVLLVLPGRGFALHGDGAPRLLAAVDDQAAADLLWSCLAGASPGATVHVGPICAGNDWALRVALDAGLSLGPTGPVFARGSAGPLRPYLPSGAFL